jgi:hypothetical protein
MKLNLALISKFVRTHKFILLTVFILFIFFFNFTWVVTEGFGSSSIGQYDYLAPPPTKDGHIDVEKIKISDDVWNAYISKWNSINCPTGTGQMCQKADDANYKIMVTGHMAVTEPELQYFAQNGYYPYNGYVTNYITDNPTIFTKSGQKDASGNLYTMSSAQQQNPNRFFFIRFIFPFLNVKNDSSDPLAYQIAAGKVPPPTSSLASPSSYMSSLSPSSSTNSSPISSSDSNYLDFVSLCKKVVGTK